MTTWRCSRCNAKQEFIPDQPCLQCGSMWVTPDLPESNPWRETVRDLYDRLFEDDAFFSQNYPLRDLARDLVKIIEDNHPSFFTGLPHGPTVKPLG